MANYYDGTKLLSLKDIDGNKPEVYICTSNRTAGKSTYFGRLLVNRFIKQKKKFALLYRFNYEIDNCANKFFNDIHELFFKKYMMESKPMSKGKFAELYLNDLSCGYAIALNDADFIKKNSHLFNDIDSILFDEFQSENNVYCSKEVEKFLSIHKSIARGHGKQWRYVPVYMVSNLVSMLNPYFTDMGISSKLCSNTKYLKGHGYVLEQHFNESAAQAQSESGLSKAFSNNKYISYSNNLIYLNDNMTFIEKPKGKSRYLATLRFNGKNFAIREYAESGVLYCDYNIDKSHPTKICATTDDLSTNFVMLKRNELLISTLRWFFEHGCFRFKDLTCKEAVLFCFSY